MPGLSYQKNDDSANPVRKKYGLSLEQAALSHRYTAEVFKDKYSDEGVIVLYQKLQKHNPRAKLHAVVDAITGSTKVLSKHVRRRLLAEMSKLYVRAKACAPLKDFIKRFFKARKREEIGLRVTYTLMSRDGTVDEERLANLFRLAVIIDALCSVGRRLGRPFNPFEWWDSDNVYDSFCGFDCEELMNRFRAIKWDAYYSDIKETAVERLKKIEKFGEPKEFATLHKTCGTSRKRVRIDVF